MLKLRRPFFQNAKHKGVKLWSPPPLGIPRRDMTRKIVVAVFTALMCAVPVGAASAAPHPMDPLSAEEFGRVKEVLKTAGHVDDNTRYPLITLLEPPKAEVLGWRQGGDFSRRARLVVRQGAKVFAAAVDLKAGKVLSWEEKSGAQSSVMLEEWAEAQEIVATNAEVQERLRARGLDPAKVYCPPISQGYFGTPEEEGKRLFKVYCTDLRNAGKNNWFGAPIEGLYIVVDIGAKKVVQVHDSGEVPLSTENMNFAESDVSPLRPALNPVVLSQPKGANFRMDGNVVEWQKWKFHIRVDRRLGLVLSNVTYNDGGRERSVLYQGYMSEMFVPYNDPDFGWFSRTYFDVGEYGLGLLSSPLITGVDCPETAAFIEDAVIADDEGNPLPLPPMVCIFERNTGDPSWRKFEFLALEEMNAFGINHPYEGRPAVDLVVRMGTQIGNYDYLIDWVFQQNGELMGRVGSTGIDALKGVKAKHMSDPTAAAETKYGMLVAPNLAAIHHDHHFNFRLDLDVDGPKNRFVRNYYELEKLPESHPRGYVYVIREESPVSDMHARFSCQTGEVQRFRVLSSERENRVGNPTSYEVMVQGNAEYILPESEWYSKRANFLQHDIWVTPHDPDERYAGGDFVFAGKGNDGLDIWTRQNRGIRDQDVVVWVNVGVNHFTRSEDMPVMPTMWKSFTLRPFNFFDRNPALDLRTNFAQ